MNSKENINIFQKASSRYGVYKFVLNEEIIYIGKADNGIASRINQHGKSGDNIAEEGWTEINASDIYFIVCPSDKVTEFIEYHLLKRYKPKWNDPRTYNGSEWDAFPLEEPEWTKYERNIAIPYNPNIPKYMQLPLSGTKLNTLQQRIIIDYRNWFILNSVKTYNMLPEHTYFMDRNADIFPEFCCRPGCSTITFNSGYNHRHILGLLSENRNSVKISLSSTKNSWESHIDQGIQYYTNELKKEICFLKENYGDDGYIIKNRNGRKQSLSNIIETFVEWYQERGSEYSNNAKNDELRCFK